MTGSSPLFPVWHEVWTSGQQRLFSGSGNPILQFTLWLHHPIVGLKADGLRIGNRDTMLFCNKPIWLGSYAPATAATAFNAGTNGWLTEAVGLSPSTTENQAAHGTQSNTPMRKKWSASKSEALHRYHSSKSSILIFSIPDSTRTFSLLVTAVLGYSAGKLLQHMRPGNAHFNNLVFIRRHMQIDQINTRDMLCSVIRIE